jgi:uncharacterized protein YdeI (BOF family)
MTHTPMHHLTLAALLTVGVMGCATDNPSSSTTASRSLAVQSQPQVIEGQVVQIERDAYIIREQSGRQTRIPLDTNTMKGDIAVGDTVIARFDGVPARAYATSVRRSTGDAAPHRMSTSPWLRTVEGIVQQLDSNYVVIRESSGRDVRLHMDNTTRVDQNIRVGDRVVAMTKEMPSDGAYATNMYSLDGSQLIQGETGNPGMIQGELVKADDNGYVVRDGNGRERTLQVGNTTRLNRRLRAGDQVVAINAAPANSPYETDVYNIYKRATANTIQGEVMRVDRDGYVVRDVTGRDVRVQADSTTLRNENIRVGDRIVADAGPSSIIHADSIERR